MTLFLEELYSSLEQKSEVPKAIFLEHVLLHLYKQGYPTGNLILEVIVNDQVFCSSNAINLTSITEPYFHGWVRFDFKGGIPKGEFTLRLSTDGSFTEENFIGWVNTSTFKSDVDPYTQPLAFQVFERKTGGI